MPLERLCVDAVPAGCDAVLAASDLQGIASSPAGGAPDLLAIALADYLSVWATEGLIPPPGQIGVLLAGDLYSSPNADVRGISGDVIAAWLGFSVAGCSWVVGVSGNHDRINVEELDASMTLLDGTCLELGDIRIAGVSGVIGTSGQEGRRTEKQFLDALAGALTCEPSVLLLHEGPSGQHPGQPGNDAIRTYLERRPPPLTMCGHVGWDDPVSALGSGHVLNLDGRAMLLAPF